MPPVEVPVIKSKYSVTESPSRYVLSRLASTAAAKIPLMPPPSRDRMRNGWSDCQTSRSRRRGRMPADLLGGWSVSVHPHVHIPVACHISYHSSHSLIHGTISAIAVPECHSFPPSSYRHSDRYPGCPRYSRWGISSSGASSRRLGTGDRISTCGRPKISSFPAGIRPVLQAIPIRYVLLAGVISPSQATTPLGNLARRKPGNVRRILLACSWSERPTGYSPAGLWNW